MTAYYNEIDPYCAQWLRNLIAAGHIAPGDVDERDIRSVEASDLVGYTQCHFFAGIGGWSYALRLAGWPDDRPVWTGSCPCQPFSVAGKGEGQADKRHLWPEFFRLIDAARPTVVMGEQVAAAAGKDWLDGVFADLEGIGYIGRAAVVPACAVDAPHRRDRLWFVADAQREGSFSGAHVRVHYPEESRGARHVKSVGYPSAGHDNVADAIGSGLAQRERESRISRSLGSESERQDAAGDDRAMADASDNSARAGFEQSDTAQGWRRNNRRRYPWDVSGWIVGSDSKARRIEPSIRLLAHGVPARVGKLRAYGNAIVPQVGAEIIAAYMECCP